MGNRMECGSQSKFPFTVKMLNNVVSVLVEMVILSLFAAPCEHLKDTIIFKGKNFKLGGIFKRRGFFKGE